MCSFTVITLKIYFQGRCKSILVVIFHPCIKKCFVILYHPVTFDSCNARFLHLCGKGIESTTIARTDWNFMGDNAKETHKVYHTRMSLRRRFTKYIIQECLCAYFTLMQLQIVLGNATFV